MEKFTTQLTNTNPNLNSNLTLTPTLTLKWLDGELHQSRPSVHPWIYANALVRTYKDCRYIVQVSVSQPLRSILDTCRSQMPQKLTQSCKQGDVPVEYGEDVYEPLEAPADEQRHGESGADYIQSFHLVDGRPCWTRRIGPVPVSGR